MNNRDELKYLIELLFPVRDYPTNHDQPLALQQEAADRPPVRHPQVLAALGQAGRSSGLLQKFC